MKYIYVMGRGHSGTTVFDAMLGNSDHIESVGELISGMGKLNSPCSCGQIMQACPYWGMIRNRFESKSIFTWQYAADASASQAHVRNFHSTLLTRGKLMTDLKEITKDLTDAVLQVSGKSALLDSSKTPGRALFLVRNFPDSKVIHLVRSPVEILASNYWRLREGRGFMFLRKTYKNKRMTPVFLILSAFAWFAGNLLAEIVKLSRPQQLIRIRYEDISVDTERQFDRLSNFLGIDLSHVAKAIADKSEMTFGHNIGGNYARMKKTFVFEPNKSGGKQLPALYRIVIGIICWPLLIRYRYKLFGHEL